jgi:hypothetical protein
MGDNFFQKQERTRELKESVERVNDVYGRLEDFEDFHQFDIDREVFDLLAEIEDSLTEILVKYND